MYWESLRIFEDSHTQRSNSPRKTPETGGSGYSKKQIECALIPCARISQPVEKPILVALLSYVRRHTAALVKYCPSTSNLWLAAHEYLQILPPCKWWLGTEDSGCVQHSLWVRPSVYRTDWSPHRNQVEGELPTYPSSTRGRCLDTDLTMINAYTSRTTKTSISNSDILTGYQRGDTVLTGTITLL